MTGYISAFCGFADSLCDILEHKKDTADYSDYIRNGGEQDADRFYTGRARIRGCFFLSA